MWDFAEFSELKNSKNNRYNFSFRASKIALKKLNSAKKSCTEKGKERTKTNLLRACMQASTFHNRQLRVYCVFMPCLIIVFYYCISTNWRFSCSLRAHPNVNWMYLYNIQIFANIPQFTMKKYLNEKLTSFSFSLGSKQKQKQFIKLWRRRDLNGHVYIVSHMYNIYSFTIFFHLFCNQFEHASVQLLYSGSQFIHSKFML